MKPFIEKLIDRKNLSSKEMEAAMSAIMKGSLSNADMATFLLHLRAKGPTVDEITGAALALRRHSIKVKTKHQRILDTCGTGGDRKGTFNISTIAAFVVAGAGVIVAKHGNRSVSSRCGSADILEALGVHMDLSAENLGKCLDDVGMAFLFAQKLHPAMKFAAPVRKELGVETIFNLLGPLTNPAGATHQVVGVYSKDLVDPLIRVLKNLGLQKAIVVHGSDGLDEITTTGATFIGEYDGQEIKFYPLTPLEYDIPLAREEDLNGGDLNVSVQIARDILKGNRGPKRDIVLLNAALALYVAGEAATIKNGITLAAGSIDSGAALKKLEQLKDFSNKHRT